MKRFNRSFIGLMEECNTGKWVLKADADNEIARVNQLCDDEMLEAEQVLGDTLRSLNDENNKLTLEVKRLQGIKDNLIHVSIMHRDSARIKISVLTLIISGLAAWNFIKTCS